MPPVKIFIATAVCDFVVYVTIRQLPRVGAAIAAWAIVVGVALAAVASFKMLRFTRTKYVLLTVFLGVLYATTVVFYYTTRRDVVAAGGDGKIDADAAAAAAAANAVTAHSNSSNSSSFCLDENVDGNSCSNSSSSSSSSAVKGFFSNIWTILFALEDDECESIISCTMHWYMHLLMHLLSPWTMNTLLDFFLSSIAALLPLEAMSIIVLLCSLASPFLMQSVSWSVWLWGFVYVGTFAAWVAPWQPLALLLVWPSLVFLVCCMVRGIAEKDFGGVATFLMCAVSLCIGYNLRNNYSSGMEHLWQ